MIKEKEFVVEDNVYPNSRKIFHCPECGEELEGGYNYDTGHIDLECKYCGWAGNETQTQEAVDEMEEENKMEMP